MNIIQSNNDDDNDKLPKDILMIKSFFIKSGIKEFESGCLNYMSEFLNSYATDILTQSKENMIFAGRNKISIDDVKLSIQKNQDLSYANKPKIDKLKENAEIINRIPLPDIPDSKMIYPSLENSILRNNFQIFSENLQKNLSEKENKNFKDNSSIRPDEVFLNNKRKSLFSKSKNEDKKTNVKKHRKLSLSQTFKKSSMDKEIQ